MLPAPDDEELARLTKSLALRMRKFLQQRGLGPRQRSGRGGSAFARSVLAGRYPRCLECRENKRRRPGGWRPWYVTVLLCQPGWSAGPGGRDFASSSVTCRGFNRKNVSGAC